MVRPVDKINLREVVDQEIRPSLQLNWVEETRVRTEIVLKPREIDKQVTVCGTEPVQVTDPATGCCSTVLQPKTETKWVKEIVFDAVPEETTYTIRRPCLKPVDNVVNVKRLVPERTTEMTPVREKYGVLIPSQVTERVLVPTPCPDVPALTLPGNTPCRSGR